MDFLLEKVSSTLGFHFSSYSSSHGRPPLPRKARKALLVCVNSLLLLPLFFCSLLPSRALFGLHVVITSWASHLRLFLHKLTPTTRLPFPFFFGFLFFFPCPPLHRKHDEHLLCNFAFSPVFKRRAAEPQVLCLHWHTGRRREIQGPREPSSSYYLTSWDVIVALHHLSKRRRGKTLTCFLWGSELRNILDPKFLSQLIFS